MVALSSIMQGQLRAGWLTMRPFSNPPRPTLLRPAAARRHLLADAGQKLQRSRCCHTDDVPRGGDGPPDYPAAQAAALLGGWWVW